MGQVIYRWNDGSTAILESKESDPAGWMSKSPASTITYKIVVRLMEGEKLSRTGVNLWIQGHGLALANSGKNVVDRIEGPYRRKLLGLLVDLGIPRPRDWSSGLIQTSSLRTHLKFPKFVDDQRFMGRYQEIVDRKGQFLGCIQGVKALRTREGAQISWHRDDMPPRDGARVFVKYLNPTPTLEEGVDWLIREENVLPSSEREAWLAENAEFGTLLLPEPDEAEVFRLLGEPLPLFWDPGPLGEWLALKGL